jgi:SNF2 family DNA or RNA helicase
MKFEPYSYQKRAIRWIEDRQSSGLLLDMGLGKSVITLTAIRDMIDNFEVSSVLVIAPKRVAEDTWTREVDKWDHLHGLKVSLVLGSEKKRLQALTKQADIYVTNRENTVWLCDWYGKDWPFDMVVIDELSSFKNPQAKRFRALKRTLPHSCRVVGLTGTPSANSLLDLWAECYLLDHGERLGRTLTSYRMTYFYPGRRNGEVIYEWKPRDHAMEAITAKLSDICLSMSADEYLTMPDRIDNEIRVKLDPQEMAVYRQMEKTAVLQIDGSDIVGLNAAAVMSKLLQMANGEVYDDKGQTVHIHDRKVEALKEIVDTATQPVLVFYHFQHDKEQILSAIPEAKILEGPESIKEWNEGRMSVLLAYPASAGYGLNLQDGGSTIVWYGLTWSLEEYQQANARLYRQGQKHTVVIHHLIAEGTVDEQVMKALKHKDTSQSALLAALKERAKL